MAFGTYDELKAEVQSFLWDRTDVVTRIPSFIALAESEARRLLRTQQVVNRQTYSISDTTGSLPFNERQILSVQLDLPDNGVGTVDLDYATPEQMASWSSTHTARPRFYGIEADRIRFYPSPDEAYTGSIIYRSAFASLGAANRSNWLLDRHPDIYLCGALKWAKAWLIDSDQDWASPFYSAIEAANRDQPMRQANARLRADDAASLNRGGGRYNVYTDSYGGIN